MFFALAYRLDAYPGAVRSAVAQQRVAERGASQQRRTVRSVSRYEGNARLTGVARNADTAPPATAESFSALNAQLGQTWFSHRIVPGEVVKETPDV